MHSLIARGSKIPRSSSERESREKVYPRKFNLGRMSMSSYSSAEGGSQSNQQSFFFFLSSRDLFFFFLSTRKEGRKNKGGKCNLNRSTAEEAEINVWERLKYIPLLRRLPFSLCPTSCRDKGAAAGKLARFPLLLLGIAVSVDRFRWWKHVPSIMSSTITRERKRKDKNIPPFF